MSQARVKFDAEKTQELADRLAQALNESGLSNVEMAYALGAAMRGVGESVYDRKEVSYEEVFTDYRASPSWPAALILHADQIHRIHEMFIQERSRDKEEEDGGRSGDTTKAPS